MNTVTFLADGRPARTDTPPMLTAALEYHARGLRVIPLRAGDKRPLVRWKGQPEPTADDLRVWWTTHPDANVGLLTGVAHGFCVVDIDVKRDGLAHVEALDLPPTRAVRTGGGGLHLYYAAPAGARAVRNRVNLVPGVDLRGDGGLVAAPPSVHASGRAYAWVEDTAGLWAALPERVLTLGRRQEPSRRIPVYPGGGRRALEDAVTALRESPEGTRNDALNRVAWHLGPYVSRGELPESEVRTVLGGVALAVGLEGGETERTLSSALGRWTR